LPAPGLDRGGLCDDRGPAGARRRRIGSRSSPHHPCAGGGISRSLYHPGRCPSPDSYRPQVPFRNCRCVDQVSQFSRSGSFRVSVDPGQVNSRVEKSLGLVGVLAITISYLMITGKIHCPSSRLVGLWAICRPAPVSPSGTPPIPASLGLTNAVVVVGPDTVEARDPNDGVAVETGRDLGHRRGGTATVVLAGQRSGGQASARRPGPLEDPDLLGVWTFRPRYSPCPARRAEAARYPTWPWRTRAIRWKTSVPGLTRAAGPVGAGYAAPSGATTRRPPCPAPGMPSGSQSTTTGTT
jgi:hypothetical protein